VSFKRRFDFRRLFFHVHREQSHLLVRELANDFVDQRHRLKAGAAPRCPEIEDDDFAAVLGKLKIATVKFLQLEIRSLLTYEWRRCSRDGSSSSCLAIARQNEFRFRRVVELPAVVRQLRRSLFDVVSEQKLVDISNLSVAFTQDVARTGLCVELAFESWFLQFLSPRRQRQSPELLDRVRLLPIRQACHPVRVRRRATR
jgi:hypothetical protein